MSSLKPFRLIASRRTPAAVKHQHTRGPFVRPYRTAMSSQRESKAGEKGTFKPINIEQTQDLPGYERELKPTSESTALEGEGGFQEYRAADKLRGKKALITGGDSGIGRAVAALFAREGADISIAYLPEEQHDAEDTKKLVEREGRECLLIPGDLMARENCENTVAKHIEKFKRVDTLVNNASKQIKCPDMTEIDLDNVESTFQSNIIQMFAITKYCLPHMREGSSIINTTSTVAFRGTPAMVDYSATKGAIVSFTRALAQQLLPKTIRVNAVAPGPVHTPIQPSSRSAEEMKNFGSKSKLGRIGQPSEIAPSFVFLASNDAELYYGQVLHAYPFGD